MIILDMSDKRPIYEQVEEKLKSLISKGLLKPDERIPSVRNLAMELSINPNTIQRAYMELERDGYIYTVKGRGNFVADVSKMLPQRQKEYYEKLDAVLEQAAEYAVDTEEIKEHIAEYFGSFADRRRDL